MATVTMKSRRSGKDLRGVAVLDANATIKVILSVRRSIAHALKTVEHDALHEADAELAELQEALS